YFYEDADLSYNYTERSEATPGFYAVDTSEGFTLVDEADTAKLWRIDACGEIDPPEEWWQRSFRGEAIVQNLDEGTGDRPARRSERAALCSGAEQREIAGADPCRVPLGEHQVPSALRFLLAPGRVCEGEHRLNGL